MQTNKPPRLRCEDKEEQRLGTALQSIRRRLINPYLQLESEDEKIQFEDEHPELQEVLQIVNWIDEKNISPRLDKAIQIQKWMKEHSTTKPPSAASRDDEERKLGKKEEQLNIARNLKKLGLDIELIKKSTGLSTEEIEKL